MSPARDQGHWRFLYDKFGTSYMGAGMGVYKVYYHAWLVIS